MVQYLLSAFSGLAFWLFWASAALFAAGMASAFILPKSQRLAKNFGIGLALLASLSLFASGALSLLGFAINPIVLAADTQIGSIGFGVDALSAFFAIIIGFVGIAVSLYSFPYIEEYEKK